MNNIKKNWIFLSLLLVYAVYAGIYIFQTSFVVDDTRYFVLFDDAMISMRYAKNLADGFGLVWNPGEVPIEGYTNPLWVILMAFFHLFPISAPKLSLAIQICGALFLLTNLIYVKKIAQLVTDRFLLTMLAVILTAFYTPLNNWGLQGMEVSALTLLLSAATWKLLDDLQSEKFSPWPYLILGFSTWVRIDMAAPYLAILGFAFLFIPKFRRQHIFWGLSTLVFFLAIQTVFRLWYYGEPVPNTFYLKMGGLSLSQRIERGIRVFFQFVWDMNWVLFLLPLVGVILRRDRQSILLALLVSGQIAYSIFVGGDAWEHKGGANRYIAMALPLFFVLFTLALDLIVQAVLRTVQNFKRPRREERLSSIILIGISLLSLTNFNFIQQDSRYLKRWLLLRPPLFIDGNKDAVDIALAVDKVSTPQAKIAVVTAGAIPYFSERPALDLLGKNDAYIAHLPSHKPARIEDVRPGHMKWDYDYSIGELKPDMVLQLWGDKEIAYKYIEQYYTVIEVNGILISARSDSEEIFWERVDSSP